jgi:type IV secretion system protein TrbE
MIIVYLAVAFAGLGMVLLVRLFMLTKDVKNQLGLDRHRTKDAGVADLLIYSAMVDEGVIVGKNGSFMAAWTYTGDDISSSTDVQRESVSFHINKGFASLGSGWMAHIDVVRTPAPGYSARELSHFPNDITRAIDEERRDLFSRLGTLYEGQFIITLTWLPPTLVERKFVELMFDDDTGKQDSRSQTLQLVDMFKAKCANFETSISAALNMKRLQRNGFVDELGTVLNHDEFLGWLNYCVSGLRHPVMLPNTPIYLDALIGGQELWPGVLPKIGRHFVQIVAIEGFPSHGYPGILNILSELPIEYRWSTRFIFMNRHEAIAHLEDYRKKWKQKVRGFFDQLFNLPNGMIDEDAQSMVNESSAAIAANNSGVVGHGYYTSVVVLMAESREEIVLSARALAETINNIGFTARVETINTMDAFLGSLPGHGVENIRRPLLDTMNLADLMPVNTIWTGENKAPCPMYPPNAPALMHCVTSGNSEFRFNFHVRDLGHQVIFGPPGAGKSTLLSICALQFSRYQNSRIYVFDKGMSMYPACMAAGGKHYRVGDNDSELAFAPLSFLKTKTQRAFAIEWIDTILALNGVQTSPDQRNEIARAITNMSENDDKTLTDFMNTVQDIEIRSALKQYSVDGFMGQLLDAEQDGLGLSRFMVFEIEKLMGMGDKYALPVLLYLFNRIEESLDGSPTIIMIDEAWLMLGHPVFREKIREWLKTLRKKNCAVIMATQNLSDASRSGILDVILESTASRVFLANAQARQEDTAIVYQNMGCNKRQIELIASAVPKRDYYYVSERGSRMFNLALGPLTLAFVGNTDIDSINDIQSLVAEQGEKWPYHWLARKGIDLPNGVI